MTDDQYDEAMARMRRPASAPAPLSGDEGRAAARVVDAQGAYDDELAEMFEPSFETCADGRRAQRRFAAAEETMFGNVALWHSLEVALRRRRRERVNGEAGLALVGLPADAQAVLGAADVDEDALTFDRHDDGPPPPTSPLRALATTSPNGPPAGLVHESALGGRALL